MDAASQPSWTVRVRTALPRGQTLPADAWARRHRWMLVFLWAHAVVLPLYGLATGYDLLHSAGHAIALIGAAVLGMAPLDRRARSCAVALGLLTASALGVHISGGLTVAHFHFFVVIPVLALYEDWLPFLLALGYVVVHHGLGGVIEPHGVYDNADAVAHPWKWATIHGAFVLAASAAAVVSWRLNEDVRLEGIAAYRTARRSEERFRRSFDDAPIGMALTDRSGEWVRVNRSLCAMTGYSEPELLGRSIQSITHPDDRAASRDDLARLIAGDAGSIAREKRYLHADGREIWVSLHASCLAPGDGEPEQFIAQITDISERKRADELARRREGQQSHVAALAELAVGGADLPELFEGALARLRSGLGVPHATLLEQPDAEGTDSPALAFALGSGEPVIVRDAATETRFDTAELEASGIAAGLSVVVTDQGGRRFGVLAAYSDTPCEFSGDDVHFLQALANLLGGAIHRERSDHELRHQSLHDPLTGLPNRLLFVDRVQHALARAQRSDETVAVVLLDLDQFKLVNDSLSHEAGDQLLQEVALRLAQHVRANDTLARFGGDEFVVLCEGLVDSSEALLVAERMRALFDEPCTVAGRAHVVSASIGVAVSSDGAYYGRHEDLVRDADAAMYRAKSAGRDRCELFDEDMRTDVVHRLNTESALRRALERDELRLFFQPLVSLHDGGVRHCEALVRWEDPERGLVPPGEFIPVAEDSGLIIPIGEWVLEEACRQAAAWDSMCISVNLSAIQVGQPGIVQTVSGALERHALSPDRLILEITETALIEDPDGAALTLQALADLGVRIALDDFGTGYSSLSSLKRYPLALIKLDRSFIADLRPGTPDAVIVGSIVAMSRSLELATVAEGVETEEQVQALSDLGATYLQGYTLARPMDGRSAATFFATRQGVLIR
jgi:diguanylate cyclase (GGDEF)-like protein/PAS domain S-box-containing protein